MNLFTPGPFTSKHGATLPDKIECDALSREDWAAVAAWFAARLDFSLVVGVEYGGCKLAEALRPYCKPGKPLLIVDDVLTTGRSMENYRVVLSSGGQPVLGAVLFSRSKVTPRWILPRFIETDAWKVEA